MRNVAAGVVLGAPSACALSGPQESRCELCPTEEFFREAAVADVRACLGAGADPLAVNYGGGSALHAAASAGADSRVLRILSAPASTLMPRTVTVRRR
ncbi:MAG: hypothetical protein OXU77_03505 [Gammaproteobacteria bacterium]|nr:hypothetical protein [Gammaproteobacteria bacterium]MDE0443497.1 hypothetical protein [Gammaproteobacteria bacterium]